MAKKDLKTLVAEEIEKGTTPIELKRVSVPDDGFKEITSREELIDKLQLLLRIKAHRDAVWNDILTQNNVYMDIKHGYMYIKHGKPDYYYHKARLFTDREAIYRRINWYGGKLKPDYDGRTVIERAECCFSVDENALKNSAAEYKGKASYTIYFGNYQVRSLCADCLERRMDIARNEGTLDATDEVTHQAALGHKSPEAAHGKYSELFRLNDDVIRAVLFQCLLFDDIRLEGHEMYANLYTIYLLQ